MQLLHHLIANDIIPIRTRTQEQDVLISEGGEIILRFTVNNK